MYYMPDLPERIMYLRLLLTDLHTQKLSVDAVSRGMVTFKLVKDFVKTRAAEDEAYPLSNIYQLISQ